METKNRISSNTALVDKDKKKQSAANAAKKKTASKKKDDVTFHGIDEKTAMAGLSLVGALVARGMKKNRSTTLIILLFVVVAAVVAGIFAGPRIKALLTPEKPPVAVINEMTDMEKAELLKNKTIEIKNIVLGESYRRMELLVLEQELQVENEWESSWGGFDIFKKTKKIVSYGTGYFDIDLSGISEDGIGVDHEKKLVTVKVPHAVLKSISIDEGKTEYEDTQKGMLSFGELKLTMEQQGLLRKSVEDSMREMLADPEILKRADEAGKASITEIYRPLVSAISDEYSVEVSIAQ